MRAFILSLDLKWEGMYVDMWTIMHTLFGFIMAYAVCKLRIGAKKGFALVLLLAVLWELGERVTGIARIEAPTNSATDVLVALLGYALGVWFYRKLGDHPYAAEIAALLATLVFAGVWVLYFLSH